MTLCRLIAPDWVLAKNPKLKKVLEREFTDKELKDYNKLGYNVYYLPNYPSEYQEDKTVDGSMIDVFNYVFVDMDLKDNAYPDKEAFLEVLGAVDIACSKVIDSGNGVHAYWKVSSLDAMSYLRFQRRLMRLFVTDEAVGQLFQLMRLPGYINTKREDNQVLCELLYESNTTYTAEELDKLLPPITLEDEAYCQQHYNKTYGINQEQLNNISEIIPIKFNKLLNNNPEVKAIWGEPADDRSKNDFRLGHIMFVNGFSKEEALSVLVNTGKALQRAPIHRNSYAYNIVDKIWTYEMAEDKDKLELSMSVKDILAKTPASTLKGVRFPCHPVIDNTAHGFRLGQVIGLVGGSGIGKTSFTLNAFKWFAERNPDYHHFFIPLEQPVNEIADRWATMCGEDTSLHEKVHIMSNYDEDGQFRHLSFDEIKEYIEKFQEKTGNKIGCVVIDHIGALKKKGTDNENQDLMTICHAMKGFAVQTNTLLIMQSQTSREKAGIGDIELDKGAAYGTSTFEWYCDYLITLWQPLKRMHSIPECPTVTAFKFCKIRHKKTRKDIIQEDVPYYLYFDSNTETMRKMTELDVRGFKFYIGQATSKRKADKKTDIVEYISVPYEEEDVTTNRD